MIKSLFTIILLLFSLISISQKTFTLNTSDKGKTTFIYTPKGQKILFNIPSFKSEGSNFNLLPINPSHPSSITPEFTCVDSKNHKYFFYVIEIGKSHFL